MLGTIKKVTLLSLMDNKSKYIILEKMSLQRKCNLRMP